MLFVIEDKAENWSRHVIATYMYKEIDGTKQLSLRKT